jgi:hypothetical protein
MTHCRGLVKNTVQVNMLVGLVNLYLLRRRLIAWGEAYPPCRKGDDAAKKGNSAMKCCQRRSCRSICAKKLPAVTENPQIAICSVLP